MNNRLILFLFFLILLFPCRGDDMIVDSYALNAMEGPSHSSRFMYELARGDKVDVLEIDGRWAKINLKGKIRYVEAACLVPTPEDIEAGKAPAWKMPGLNQKHYGDFGWFFSTDRIMEALPSLNLLEKHLPFDPEISFTIAVWILAVTAVTIPFLYSRIRYGNFLYWSLYAVSMVLAVCELLYILGSSDPLGYCDINNMSFSSALFNVILTGIAMLQQLKLYSTIMFVAEDDTDFNFSPGVGIKLLLVVTLYFIVVVFARHFFHTTFPEYVTWGFLALLAIPVFIMLYGMGESHETSVFFAMMPFYLLMTAATLAFFCIIGVVIALFFVLSLLLTFFLSGQTYDVKYRGVWYYCDYDTWLEGARLGLWENMFGFGLKS